MRRLPFIALLLAGCASADPPIDVRGQRARVGYDTAGGGFVSSHLLPVDTDGAAVGCSGRIDVVVVTSFDRGKTWTEVDGAEVSCVDSPFGDVALVTDNSGSTREVLSALEDGTRAMAESVIAAGGRASVVRVSTEAEITAALTSDLTDIETALDTLRASNGWTALWDGIRVANETLGGEVLGRAHHGKWDDAATFCEDSDRLGIVAFTDGRENNSDDGQEYDHDKYPGDGFDTDFDDLIKLQVDGQGTPIYTIGLGSDPHHGKLRSLASATGGEHIEIDDTADITDAYDLISDYFESTWQVCAELTESACGAGQVKVSWSYTPDGEEDPVSSGEAVQDVVMDCPATFTGRRATALLTMSNPHLDPDDVSTLANQLVAWVSPKTRPRVLVVLDDNHHGEFDEDADYVAKLLKAGGYKVTLVDEPEKGLSDDDLDGYDVVWFSNPGYPPDDAASIEALEVFGAAGGGIVLQGDDMTRGAASSFSMTELTGLAYVDNGTAFCGARTDDNEGDRFEITVGDDHDVVTGLEGATWYYGDDIDVATPVGGTEVVIADATLEGSSGCGVVPVVVTIDATE